MRTLIRGICLTMASISLFGCMVAGKLVDSAVSGIDYETETQSGITGDKGQFFYQLGETVTFSVGQIIFPDVVMGSTFINGTVTPLDIAGSTDFDSNAVINIARLLQTLDADQNPDNGISIDSNAITTAPLDFNASPANFAAEVLADLGQTLVPQAAAIAHLEKSVEELVSRGLPASIAGETFTMEYCCAQSNSPYANGQQVDFIFYANGGLNIGENSIAERFKIDRSGDDDIYIWTDKANGYEYHLSLTLNDEMQEVNIRGIGGSPFYGQFAEAAAGSTPQAFRDLASSYTLDITQVFGSGFAGFSIGSTLSLTIDGTTGAAMINGETLDPSSPDFVFTNNLATSTPSYRMEDKNGNGDALRLVMFVEAGRVVALTYSETQGNVTDHLEAEDLPLPNDALSFLSQMGSDNPTFTVVKKDPNFGSPVGDPGVEVCDTFSLAINGNGSAATPYELWRVENGNQVSYTTYSRISTHFDASIESGAIIDLETLFVKRDDGFYDIRGYFFGSLKDKATSNPTEAAAACPEPPSFNVTGSVTGISSSPLSGGEWELYEGLNWINDGFFSANDGAVSFGSVTDGESYEVRMNGNPTGYTCSVINGAGTISGADVTNVEIACSVTPSGFTISGTITGITGSPNSGGQWEITGSGLWNDGFIFSNGPVTFATEVANGTEYNLIVSGQPTGYTCNPVSGANGAVSGADITNVEIACSALP